MGTKIEYVDSSHMYATNYIRNSKAIAVLWAIFTICYTIISVVAFVTPGGSNLFIFILIIPIIIQSFDGVAAIKSRNHHQISTAFYETFSIFLSLLLIINDQAVEVE